MKNAWTKRLVGLATALLMIAFLPAAEAAKGKSKKAKDGKSDQKEEEKWDVSAPGGDWKTANLDTTETTWSEVDVSPDGRTIVFDMLGDIYSVPIEGGEATRLSEDIPWDFQPRFSPDGSKIAFVSDRGGADNLWVMNVDGSDPQAVSEEKVNLVHNPCWSPDGQYIAAKKGFVSTRSIPAGEIWLFHAGGGGGLQLTERPNEDKDQKTMAEPSFSPDGRYVYYSQDTTPGRVWQYNKDSTGQIFVVKRLDRETGKTVVFVSGPGGAIRPTPSPDGKQLAFVKRIPGMKSALYVKNLESGIELPVYTSLDRDLQETNGSQGNAPAFAWTPDSGSIVFWAGGKIQRVNVSNGATEVVPIHVRVAKKVRRTLRFPVEVAPDEFDVKMLRWSQKSPDGSKAVFQALGRLYVKDLPDGEARRITRQDDHFEFWPSFSPDGRSVVYTTWDDQDLGSIRVVPVSGGAGRAISADPGHYIEPRLSADGQSVVYRKIAGGFLLSGAWSQEPGIYVTALNGGTPKRVTPSGFDAQFSPDGKRVFFSATDDTKLLLKSVNLEGHDEQTHLEGDEVREYRISPDGRYVAFTEQYNAYVAPFTLTGKTVSIGSQTKSIPVRQVSARSGEFLHWSANGTSLNWGHGAVLYSRDLKDAFGFLDGAPEELPEPAESGIDLGFRVPADKPSGSIALRGARIVTMRDARSTQDSNQEVIDNGVVLVTGNRIVAVGPASEVTVPVDARVIDVSGKTIIPGLVDVHAHGAMARSEITPEQNWAQFSNLAFGVTTIHDPSNDTSSIFSAAELQRSGLITAPRIYSTGTILYGANAPGFKAKIDGIDDATFHVRRLKDVGAISVKSYQQPRREQRQQVIAAANEMRIMVVPEGGAKFQHNMNQIVDGHTGIEHALPLFRIYEDVEQLWSQTDVGYTPTFGVAYGGLSGENYWYDRTEVWNNERLLRYTPRKIVEPRSIRRTTAPDEHYNHFGVARMAKRLVDRGVRVQIGAHGQREGLAAHWEMWMMHQGGFTPWEALRAATLDGAYYIGMDGDIGSIEAGKLADLVVIDGNPLADLRRSEFVSHTMINGRLYDAATMNQVAPDPVQRQEFFFERDGGDTIHPSTQAWVEELYRRHGWVH